MLQTAIVLDPRYKNHKPGPGHPESMERIGALLQHLETYTRAGLSRVPPRLATPEEVALIHDPSLISKISESRGNVALDPDTRLSSGSYDTALLATGGLLEIIDRIMERDVDNGFALVRPPGHHAERNKAMGFCLFNSVAIATEYLRSRFGLQKVLVVDWDLHHGNGTQHSFYDDSEVLYISTHQFPFYPGTGSAVECGHGNGQGYTVNIPLAPGMGDETFLPVFEDIVDPICRRFDPDFILISAGFDAHVRDPLGQLAVTENGFGALARILLRLARDHAQGRCAAILEGGYDLVGLTTSTLAMLEEMQGHRLADPVPEYSRSGRHADVYSIQQHFWSLPRML